MRSVPIGIRISLHVQYLFISYSFKQRNIHAVYISNYFAKLPIF